MKYDALILRENFNLQGNILASKIIRMKKKTKTNTAIVRRFSIEHLYGDIRTVLEQARSNVYQFVNTAMVQAYWQIGRIIVEEEQKGKLRAEYGAGILNELSKRLTKDYGKGFDESNLRNIRAFYIAFPKCDAVRHELTWTH